MIAYLRNLIFFLAGIPCLVTAQESYTFQQDDSLLKEAYYNQSVQKKTTVLKSIGRENAKEYKKIYEEQFTEIQKVWEGSRAVTDRKAHDYLQQLVKKITAADPVLKGSDARVVFSRDWWPNAYSMGDGTIVINAGLMVYLDNEAQLAFIIAHELAHYHLQHSQKSITKYVQTINSEDFQRELKRLSKEQYGANKQLEQLAKNFSFDSHRHSRDNEAEADRFAFTLLRPTAFDKEAIRTGLALLDKIDDSLLHAPLELEKVFHFTGYPFKKKWIQNESAIFSQLKETKDLSKAERDSLKTHPDCSKRIALLNDSIATAAPGQLFLVNKEQFSQLKKDFFIELTEQCYRDDLLSRNLYNAATSLQAGFNPFAVWTIARCLNKVYELQKNHKLGLAIDTENKAYAQDYNLLLRMLNRIRLEELVQLNMAFCISYQDLMKGHAAFNEEYNKLRKIKSSQSF